MAPSFGDIGKTIDALFRKDYRYGALAKLSSVAPDGVGFDVSIGSGKKPGVIMSHLNGKIERAPLGLSLRGGIDSGNKWSLSAAQDDRILSGLQLSAKMIRTNGNGTETSERGEHAVIGGRYKWKWGTGKVECELQPSGARMSAESAVSPRKGLKMGGKIWYKLARGDMKHTGQMEKSEFRGEYATPNYTVFGRVDTFGDITLSFVQKWDSKVSVGGLYEHKARDGYTLFTLGGTFRMSPTSAIKGKVASNGVIEAALAHKLNEYAEVMVSTQLNTATWESADAHKLGLAISLHDTQ